MSGGADRCDYCRAPLRYQAGVQPIVRGEAGETLHRRSVCAAHLADAVDDLHAIAYAFAAPAWRISVAVAMDMRGEVRP